MNFLNEHSGFTLIELLVVIGIIGILSATSVSVYQEYREKAYYATSQQMFQNARTALAAAKTSEDDLSGVYVALSNAGTTFSGTNPQQITPGLVPDDDMYVYLYHNAACAVGVNCTLDYITVRHCKVPWRLLWYRLGTGYEYTTLKLNSPIGC